MSNEGPRSPEVDDIYSDMYSAFSQMTSSTRNDIDSQPYPITLKTIGIYVGSTIGGLLFGYDTGVIPGVLLTLTPEDLGRKTLEDFQRELVTGVTSLGSLAGSIIAFKIVDRQGRKKTLLICSMVFMASGLIMALANSLAALVVGRLIVGVAIGIAAQCVPVYLAEISPERIRGGVITLNTMAITGGQLLAYLVSFGVLSFRQSWRILFALGIIPAFLFILLLDCIPESPRWLILNNKLADAREALRLIYPLANHHDIDKKLAKMIHDLTKLRFYQDETQPLLATEDPLFRRSSWISFRRALSLRNMRILFTPRDPLKCKVHHKMEPRTYRALFVGCVLMFFQQASGFNAFMYYSAVIFQRIGVDAPFAPAMAVALTNFLFTGISFKFVDKIGRRKLLLITIPVTTAGLVMNSYAFESNSVSLIIVSTAIFVAGYATGIGTIPWTSVEFLPLNRRSLGATCISCTNWFANSILSMTFLSLTNKLGNETSMLTFAAITILSWFFVYFFYPEVKGLSLEEVGRVFENGIDVYYVYRTYHS
ncbi:LAMI_0E14554g1_1 [Lachancea mirantina]|uniref:LAMI_0E14554g1_1 n=1 Tax=Lachancea mirantina TaxID=1230905 RepID=A0A1G4JS27_9SACH|nr:LAMI_0E14554g1_1 [Lachancea mirantina]